MWAVLSLCEKHDELHALVGYGEALRVADIKNALPIEYVAVVQAVSQVEVTVHELMNRIEEHYRSYIEPYGKQSRFGKDQNNTANAITERFGGGGRGSGSGGGSGQHRSSGGGGGRGGIGRGRNGGNAGGRYDNAKKDIQCFRCKGPHFVRDCPHPAPDNRQHTAAGATGGTGSSVLES